MAGQQVTPIFCFRNTGQSTLDALFPRLMMVAAITTKSSRSMRQEKQSPSSRIQVWQGLSDGSNYRYRPVLEHEISGLPIVLGDVDRGSAETAILQDPESRFASALN